jgi:hypothetical protein
MDVTTLALLAMPEAFVATRLVLVFVYAKRHRNEGMYGLLLAPAVGTWSRGV